MPPVALHPRVFRVLRFVRRRPFPWLLAASLLAACVVAVVGDDWEYTVRSHEQQALNYLFHAAGLALPLAVTAVWWRRVGVWARSSALLVCVLWSLLMVHRATFLVESVGALARNAPVVDEMLREPRRAMRTPPEEAAARALAAGDTSFLAQGGGCASIGGVDTAIARRHGVRVISGTFHDGESLTAEHRDFGYGALMYADSYNRAILERLGIEPGGSSCVDLREFRRAGRPFFWP